MDTARDRRRNNARMNAEDFHLRRKTLGQRLGEKKVRKLGIRVTLIPFIREGIFLQYCTQAVGISSFVLAARKHKDAAWRARYERRKQRACEFEMSQMIGRKLQLKTLRRIAFRDAHHARVVHKQMKRSIAPLLRKDAHRFKIRQIQVLYFQLV